MEEEKKLFRINFDESIKNYNRSDGLVAICLFGLMMIYAIIFGIVMIKIRLYEYLEISNFFYMIIYLPYLVIFLSSILFYITYRKQKLKSIGLRTDNIIKSIGLGVLFSLPFIFQYIIFAIKNPEKIMNIEELIWRFLYFLIYIAFMEELIFRGFIQTRIQGIIKSKWKSIIAVGIMFSVLHIPFHFIKSNMSFVEYLGDDMGNLIKLCLIHIYLVYLYTRDYNIISVTITHMLIDFIPAMFISN